MPVGFIEKIIFLFLSKYRKKMIKDLKSNNELAKIQERLNEDLELFNKHINDGSKESQDFYDTFFNYGNKK